MGGLKTPLCIFFFSLYAYKIVLDKTQQLFPLFLFLLSGEGRKTDVEVKGKREMSNQQIYEHQAVQARASGLATAKAEICSTCFNIRSLMITVRYRLLRPG